MRIRPRLVSALLFAVLALAGCSSTGSSRPEPKTAAFPERPAGYLAKTPEQCLAGNMTQKGTTLRGGWGFGRNDAFVLTVPTGRARAAFHNTVPLESHLISTRNELEFGSLPAGQRYAVVDYGTVTRTLGTHDGRMYSVWRGRVRLIPEKEAPELYREAAGRPLASRDHLTATPSTISVPREYWFDITDTFGSHKPTQPTLGAR